MPRKNIKFRNIDLSAHKKNSLGSQQFLDFLEVAVWFIYLQAFTCECTSLIHQGNSTIQL